MIHINNFVDRIKFFEARGSKDFIFPISEAKNLHADITKLLLVVHEQSNNKFSKQDSPNNSELNGGDW